MEMRCFGVLEKDRCCRKDHRQKNLTSILPRDVVQYFVGLWG